MIAWSGYAGPFTVVLLLVLAACTRYLWRLEKREAEERRIERVLRNARYRPDRGDADAVSRWPT